MEDIRKILQKENICLENLSIKFCKRIQILKTEFSEDFKLSREQLITLKEELPFENINDVTLKKVIENLVVAKHLKRRNNDKSLFELLEKNCSYRFFPSSFYYSKN